MVGGEPRDQCARRPARMVAITFVVLAALVVGLTGCGIETGRDRARVPDLPVGRDSDPTLVRAFQAEARSVRVQGRISGLGPVRVDSSSNEGPTVPVEVVSGPFAGEHHTIHIIAGSTITGDFVVDGTARLAPDSIGVTGVVGGGPFTVSDGAVHIDTEAGPAALPVPLEVRATSDGTDREGAAFEASWANAGDSVAVEGSPVRGEGRVSWAGPGSVDGDSPEESIAGEWLNVRTKDMVATVERTEEALAVHGDAILRQVYLDGVPQLRTTATVDLIRTRREIPAGESQRVTWAPRNLGDIDMVILRIRPASPAASWLSLGLGHGPRLHGLEERPAVGGDTEGFRSGRNIAAVIRPELDARYDVIPHGPRGADRRDISVRVPSGTAPGIYVATVVVEGNFEPIEVDFEVTVVPPR